MGPLTRRRAKPALRLFDLPLIAWPMAFLARAGVERLVVNLHHLPRTIEPELGRFSRKLGLRLRLSPEPEILGTGGGLGAAAPLLLESGPATMLLLNGDSLFFGDLRAAGEAHRAGGAEASMLLQPPPPAGGYGLVQTDRRGRVVSIAGKPVPAAPPAEQWMFIGIHCIEPALLRRIPAGRALDINAEVYRGMIGSGETVAGLPVCGSWLDFGTPRAFLDSTQAMLLDRVSGRGVYPLPLEPPGHFNDAGPSYCGPGARISPNVQLHAVAAYQSCAVGPGSSLTRCLLMENCSVGREVRLEDCLVGPDTVLPEGFAARGELLAWNPADGTLDRRPLVEV
jgi:mannose-1-phosphate guanylyltransferase